eukprot:CAMPEP_0177671280 /NCGR_PEP_ID=MMETSP0447-20121125/24609_1 /TAXON_ID=0 /ORGANISM="Stygamoeba regulata, Strain BSH-02190019" /LENGTH=764 /DNA_ID=CAMNT_0019178641 /DNA_START=66 /DNA_END=2360 /DNA_ORIENTATION=-
MNFQKKKVSALEHDIEKARNQEDWSTAASLVKRYAKYTSDSPLIALVKGEQALESDEVESASQKRFAKVLSMEHDNVEALCLMGRLHFEAGRLTEALDCFAKIRLNDSEKVSGRKLRLVLEAFEDDGIALEKLKRPAEAVSSYEKLLIVAKRSLAHLNEKTAPFVETAILHSSTILVHLDDVPRAVQVLREGIRTRFALPPATVLKILQELGELLMLKTSSLRYSPPSSADDSVYIPRSPLEEALLVFLLAEEVRTELSLQEHEDERDTTIVDSQCLGYTRAGDYASLVKTFERQLATFQDTRTWFQFALSLYCAKQYSQALIALKECNTIDPNNPSVLLLCARVCYNHLGLIEDCITYSRQAVLTMDAVERSTNTTDACKHPLHARALIGLGAGLSGRAESLQKGNSRDRKELHREALEAFLGAYACDPNDWNVLFAISLEYAKIRDIKKAMSWATQALKLNRDNPEIWRLIILLWTSEAKIEKALDICQLALSEHPENNELLHLRVKLLLCEGRPHQALKAVKELMIVYNRRMERLDMRCEGIDCLARSVHSSSQRTSSVARSKKGTFSRTKSIGHFAELSDLRSQPSDTHQLTISGLPTIVTPVLNSERAYAVRMWLQAAEPFLALDEVQSALGCVQEARRLDPSSPDALFFLGKVEEHSGNLDTAIDVYSRALRVDDHHERAKISLARLCHTHRNDLTLAENYLTTVIRNNSNSHEAWNALGHVFKSKKDPAKASECFALALKLQNTAPALPFEMVELKI